MGEKNRGKPHELHCSNCWKTKLYGVQCKRMYKKLHFWKKNPNFCNIVQIYEENYSMDAKSANFQTATEKFLIDLFMEFYV